MEEAYAELYQEFLRLRSLCLKQAALLHQLTSALQKQRGSSASNGEMNEIVSIPVQCTFETAGTHDAAGLRDAGHACRNVGSPACLLAEDMSKLCVNEAYQEKQNTKVEKIDPFMLTLDSSKRHVDSSNESKTPRPSLLGVERTLYKEKVPVSDGTSLTLMSDVVLQSTVCEFCHAVFPGNTTTGGDYLQHLYTHVT